MSPGGGGGCDGRALVLVNCSGCHDGVSETTGFLDLRSPESIVRLVGKPASSPTCAGGGAVLIDGDGGGLFVDKLRSPPPCGDQMPQGTFPLSADEIACVASWVATVAANAPPDDVPPAACPGATGEVDNAVCNDVAASGPCVAPVMLDDSAPGPLGGPLAEGAYDLAARVVYTNPGGATGPAGEPLARTIVLTGAEASWSMQEATLAAAASRRTTTLVVAGPSMQLRATATCPADGDPSAGTGTATLYYTAADATLILYQLGATGPIQADTYTRRSSETPR